MDRLMGVVDRQAQRVLANAVVLDGRSLKAYVYTAEQSPDWGQQSTELVEFYADVFSADITGLPLHLMQYRGQYYDVVRAGEPDETGLVRLYIQAVRGVVGGGVHVRAGV